LGSPIVHFEFWSANPAQAAAFYQQVFGWNIQHLPEMDYHMVDTASGGVGINGGIFKPKDGPIPAPTSLYLDVDDLDAYGRKITAAGGRLVVEKQEVPGMGTFSLFTDPDGRMLGIWKRVE
jgi:predicted enzyme related to lactoylglutathione lyase